MFCQYQYYRWGTKQLQAAKDHSDARYKCMKISAGRCDIDLCSDCARKNNEAGSLEPLLVFSAPGSNVRMEGREGGRED